MLHAAGLAVHQVFGSNHISTKRGADGLVSEADAEDGQLSGKVLNQFNADSSILGRAGAWRNNDALGAHLLNLRDGCLIVAADFDVCAQLTEVLDEVERE